jgi:hypothetical protein
MSQQVPFWPVRVALFKRLETDEATSGHALRSDGTRAAYPFLALGPMTYADEATDTTPAGEVLVQIDAWANVEDAGGRDVNVMASDAVEAVSRSALVLEDYPEGGDQTETEYLGLETALMQEDYDSAREVALYHAVLRARLHVIQGGVDLSGYAPPPS